MIAGVLSFTNATTGTASSKYVGIPKLNEPLAINWLINNFEIIIIIVIFSVIAGIGLGLIISGMTIKKEEKPRLVEEYKQKPEDPYLSKDEMPRSIIDYYKKNK